MPKHFLCLSSCKPFSVSGACDGKARPPRQAAMYVRSSFLEFCWGSSLVFGRRLQQRTSTYCGSCIGVLTPGNPEARSPVVEIVGCNFDRILARHKPHPVSAAEHPELQDWNLLYCACRHTAPESTSPKTPNHKPYMTAMEPYLPELVPLLLPPPEPSAQPLHCPHGFWNAPGSKGKIRF